MCPLRKSVIMSSDSGMNGYNPSERSSVTSHFCRKVMQISNYDMHVIVDNYVEMGDFF